MQVALPPRQALPLAVQSPPAQQPPFAQTLFSQQGSPAPPQLRQLPPKPVPLRPQATEEAVQKSAAFPFPPQQPWLFPPQPPQPPWLQVPSPPPQLAPAATQTPPVQQPLPLQLRFAQQGPAGAPQATKLPFRQTVPVAPAALSPEGMQLFEVASRQAPLAQGVVAPAQGGWYGPPQATQLEPEQLPVAHAAPGATHWPVAPSQQPLLQLLPAQHGSPGAPQARQPLPEQIVAAPVQLPPAQQGSPAPPQISQLPAPVQTVPVAVQLLPAQQGSPTPPQTPQLPFAQSWPLPQPLPVATQ